MIKLFSEKKAEAQNFVMKAIVTVIAVSMIPAIVAGVNSVIPNLSGGALIMIGLVTLVFVAVILMYLLKGLGKN